MFSLPTSSAGLNRPTALAIAATLTATACDDAPPQPEASSVTVWDSAGIEIVENHAPEWGDSALWTVDPEPEFVIGGTAVIESPDDPSQLIWNVRGVARLTNGNILVHSGGEEAVFLFEPTGELVTRIGRTGEGPGEFVRPQHIQVLPGDTIAVWDYMFTGVNYFDSTGLFLRKRPIDVATVLASTRTATETSPESIRIPLRDGSFIVGRGLRERPPLQPGEIRRPPVEYLRIDTAYVLHSFGWWRSGEVMGMRSRWHRFPWPTFPRRSLVAAAGLPPSVYVTDGDRFEVRQFAADGTLDRILRRDAAPVPITSDDLADWKARAAESTPNADWAEWERTLVTAPPREFHPAILGLFVDTEGYLWVWEPGFPGPGVFDPAGRWLGRVEGVPDRPQWIDEEMILLLRTDPETDVQRIEGYRLRRN